MNRKSKILLGAGVVASIAAGIALATPTIGVVYNVVLSTGIAARDLNAHAHVEVPGMHEDFSVVLSTDGASNIIQQEIKFAPGGTTGWHKHPGIVLLTLAADSSPID